MNPNEHMSMMYLQASGSQESMGNGAASGQDQAHQPDKTQAGVEEAAVARNPAQSVAASSNHTPIRSSFEDVPGLAIRYIAQNPYVALRPLPST